MCFTAFRFGWCRCLKPNGHINLLNLNRLFLAKIGRMFKPEQIKWNCLFLTTMVIIHREKNRIARVLKNPGSELNYLVQCSSDWFFSVGLARRERRTILRIMLLLIPICKNAKKRNTRCSGRVMATTTRWEFRLWLATLPRYIDGTMTHSIIVLFKRKKGGKKPMHVVTSLQPITSLFTIHGSSPAVPFLHTKQ